MRLKLSLMIFTLVSCASEQKVAIKSYPEKAIVTLETSSGEKRTLGETPLLLDRKDVFPSGTVMGQLEVSKEGFEHQKIFLAADARENFDVSLKLRPVTLDARSEKLKDRQEQLAKSLARVTNLLSKKRLDEAENLLQGLSHDYSHVSVVWDFLGNISYLKRDFRSALGHYRKSLTINPDNLETKQLVQKLEVMN